MSDMTSEERDEMALAQRVRQIRQRRLASFSPEALAWLALPPGWTERLAHECGFPHGRSEIREFVDHALRAGLCEASDPAPPLNQGRSQTSPREGRSFWMSNGLRREILSELRGGNSQSILSSAVKTIAQRIASLEEVPPAMARWAQLASEASEAHYLAGSSLMQRMNDLIKQNRLGEALAWATTGESLALALGGTLETAVRAANRLIELAYRRAQDERYLEHYVEREEQIDAFQRLIRDDERWALHFIGMGGVGKTMLLRFITSKLAPKLENGTTLPGRPTARVDFDYLSPDYPALRPGQLLLELAAEFRIYAGNSRVENALRTFHDTIAEWHEELNAKQPARSQSPLANLEGPLFDKAIRGFADILRLLRRPALLILDTCEELTKSPVVDQQIPSVEATFRILEALHAQVSSLRVICAGRRLLARAGSDWRLDAREGTTSAPSDREPSEGQYLPARKDYLLLHEIRGFARDDKDRRHSDVDRYFERRQLRLAGEVREAILERSRAIDSSLNLIRSTAEDARPRYNPFDLALYSDWLADDPDLPVEIIRSGQTDPYVELRIVRRIHNNELQNALPAIILLRRFDQQMLRPLIGDRSLFDVYRDLGEQEWITYQTRPENASNHAAVLEVNRELHRRLLAYYEHPSRRHLLVDARKRLAPALRELAERPLGELIPEYVDAMFRVLDEREASDAWESIVRRVPVERDWVWLQRVIGLMRSEVGAVSVSTHPLFAAVRAAEISVQIHLTPSVELESAWAEVAATAHRHPDLAVGKWLECRAWAGRIAARRDPLELPELAKRIGEWFAQTDWEGDTRAPHHGLQLIGSAIATLESLVEVSREGAQAVAPVVRDALLELASPQSVAFATEWSVPAIQRLLANGRPESSALSDLQTYIRLLAECESDPTCSQDAFPELVHSVAQGVAVVEERVRLDAWLDWRAPESMIDRLRLETLLIVRRREGEPRVGSEPTKAPSIERGVRADWLADARQRLHTIDAERLASLLLELRLAQEVMLASELREIGDAETFNERRLPTCYAHRTVPPLVVSLAQGHLALGRARVALTLLETRTEKIVGRPAHAYENPILAVTQAHVIWRMRWASRAKAFVGQARNSSIVSKDEFDELRSVYELGSIFDLRGIVPPGIMLPHSLSVGPRREALVSLAQADWVNGQPEQCEPLYELSAKRFSAVNDVVGVLMATIGRAVARIRWGGGLLPEAELRKVRDELEAAYRSLVATEDLPSWDRLVELSGDIESQRLDEFFRVQGPESDWNGWLQRLLTCLVWLDDALSDVSRQQWPRWEKWVELQYGKSPPVELSLWGATPPNASQQEAVETAAAEYSIGWFVALVGIKLFNVAVISAAVFTAVWKVYAIGIDTGADVWSYTWRLLVALFMAAFAISIVEPESAESPERETGWWARCKRRLRSANEASGWWSQFIVKALTSLEAIGVFGLLLALVGSIVLLGRWLWRGYLASAIAGHEVDVAILGAFALALAVFLFFRKRLFAALQAVATSHWLQFDTETSTRRLDSAATIDYVVNYRRRQFVISWSIVRHSWAYDWLKWFLPFSSEVDEKSLDRIDYQQVFPFLPNYLSEAVANLLLRGYVTPTVEKLAKGRTPGLSDYAEGDQPIPREVSDELSELKDRLWYFRVSIPLRVAPSLAFVPWEAMLARSLRPDGPLGLVDRLMFFRWGDALPEAARERAEEAWRSGGSADFGHDQSGLKRSLFVVGSPRVTSSGLRLRVASNSRSGAAKLASSTAMDEDELIASSDVLQRDAWLVVVQSPPAEITRRVESDREQSALLRTFAAEVFEAGGAAVLAVPAMHSVLSSEIRRRINSRLEGRSPPGDHDLVSIVQELRRVITEWRPGGEATPDVSPEEVAAAQLEIAFDVCLFARRRPLESYLLGK